VQFHKIRTALISGVIVSGLVSQWLIGSYLYLGYPSINRVGFSFLPIAIINGVATGALGAMFGKLLLNLVNRRLAIKDNSKLITLTLATGLIMASLNFLDSRASGTGVSLITDFLFGSDRSDLKLIILRYFGTIVSYLSGAAGGIFSPSLAIGAAVGSFLSRFVGADYNNLMILLGMIGFLTGVTRTPFTAFILVLEMTDRHRAIFPMMMAAVSAQWVAHLIDNHSFYEHMKVRYLKEQSDR
jgi:H+/Cl- antiporter ClcA